jgi:hypothetical protein
MAIRIHPQKWQQEQNGKVHLFLAVKKKTKYVDNEVVDDHKNRGLPSHTDKAPSIAVNIVDTKDNRKKCYCKIRD